MSLKNVRCKMLDFDSLFLSKSKYINRYHKNASQLEWKVRKDSDFSFNPADFGVRDLIKYFVKLFFEFVINWLWGEILINWAAILVPVQNYVDEWEKTLRISLNFLYHVRCTKNSGGPETFITRHDLFVFDVDRPRASFLFTLALLDSSPVTNSRNY